MSSRGSSPVEDHGNMFAEPEDYYPPTPPPTTQEYTTHDGKTITLHLVGFSPTEAHHLWNGARVISDYFETNPDVVRGKTVLELGAGAGLPSIVAAVLGAKKVVMTDYPDNDIVEVMWKNVDGCDLLLPRQPSGDAEPEGQSGQRNLIAKGYIWGYSAAPLLAELPEGHAKFDILILADLLFRHTEHGHLLDTIRDTLGRTPESKAFVFFTSYRPWLRHKDLAFFDLARERGFVVDKVLERVMERPMFEDDPGDEEVRKTCTGWEVRWPQEECAEESGVKAG
ncbi:Protein N-terminal and lysine N-methyltransferase efm7 [Gnomoniopsis sp. IMI 355080]|nr:Protein N-terminal and lysine N-methyltransferase efm7 [Gnomoniopsis sp. IMI 355080]